MSISGIATQECLSFYCRCVTEVSPHIHDPSKELNIRHARGYIWTLSNEFPRSSKRQIIFVWNCHSSGQCPSKTDITAQIICCATGTVAPSPVLWMYNLMNVFCPLQILGGGVWVSAPSVSTMCSVLLFRIASSKLQPRATISMHLKVSISFLHIR